MNASRRALLRSGGVFLTGAIAGCLGSSDAGSTPTPTPTPTHTPTPTTTGETVESLPTPTLGTEDAPVTVAVYEDFACGHCMRYVRDTFPSIRGEYIEEGIVRYEHHDFPIPVDERWSWAIGSAARAVQDTRGDASFFEFAKTIFEHFDDYSLDTIESIATDVGADPQRVRSAAKDVTYGPVLVSDRERGLEAGVEGTPTIFVNGSPTSGYGWETVSEAIEAARN